MDDKGRESKKAADGGTKKVVATRTVDKLLEQSRLSAPGSVRGHGTEEKKAPEAKAVSPSKVVEHNRKKEKPVRQEKSRRREKAVVREKESSNREKGTARLKKLGSVGHWFQVLCFMHIPVFGFLYMLVKALRKKTPEEERYFAIAYLLYQILILFLALTILYVLYRVGLQFVDGILDYAGMGD